MSTRDAAGVWLKCECCEEFLPDASRRDGTGDPDAIMCDECHAEMKRQDVDPVQW